MIATRALLLGVVLASSLGCSPIVGADCRAPLVACGHYCIDVRVDVQNCGTCGTFCTGGTMCVAGTCLAVDAAMPDDAGHDAGRDAGLDASVDAAHDAAMVDLGNDTGLDVGVDASDIGPPDAGPPRCSIGQRLCGALCVSADDPDYCGDCTTVCGASEVCDDGACASACSGTSMACAGTCTDLASDHDHCGDCATACTATQVCRSRTCVAAGSGHVVVIGHDYVATNGSMSVLLANAVTLGGATATRVLTWTGDASSAIVMGTNAALASGAGGLTYTLTDATDADDVIARLDRADAFLVYAQDGATTAQIDALAAAWSAGLNQFVGRGGVVVVLDTPALANNGTNQVLSRSGLFLATSHSELLVPTLTAVVGHAGDAVLSGVTLPYVGQRHTVDFTSLDTSAVLTAAAGPVVFHRVVTH